MNRKYSKYNDKQLVELLNGSPEESEGAFTEIYDRYGLRLNAYCFSILHDRQKAEDVFQETFLRFYQNVKSNVSGGSIIGFLITIARNLCLNVKRDTKPTTSIEDFDLPGELNNSYEDKEMSELLVMALDLMEDEIKEALVLRFFDGLRYEEIAKIMKITAARARYLTFTGKKKLKSVLSPYMKDVFQ